MTASANSAARPHTEAGVPTALPASTGTGMATTSVVGVDRSLLAVDARIVRPESTKNRSFKSLKNFGINKIPSDLRYEVL